MLDPERSSVAPAQRVDTTTNRVSKLLNPHRCPLEPARNSEPTPRSGKAITFTLRYMNMSTREQRMIEIIHAQRIIANQKRELVLEIQGLEKESWLLDNELFELVEAPKRLHENIIITSTTP